MAALDRHLDRLAGAELEERVAGDRALLLRAAGEMPHAADREHLRAVLGGRDVPDLLALDAHRRRFGAEMAVGVDLHLDAAIAEDALGHDRDGVDALVLGRDDEGRGLVVGIGRAGADAGEERARGIEHLPVPIAPCERDHPPAIRHRPLHQHDGIGAHELALDRWRSGCRRRRARAGCGRAPDRHRSARCPRPRPRRTFASARGRDMASASAIEPTSRARRNASHERCGSTGTSRIVDAVAWRIADEDGGGGRDQGRLADALGAEGAFGLRVLDQAAPRSRGMSPTVGIR